MTELLPCPFCGGEATVRSSGYLYRAVCDTCGSEGSYATKDIKAAKAWNTRHVETCELHSCDGSFSAVNRPVWRCDCGAFMTQYTDATTYHRPRYCPNCGRKVEG